MFHILLQLNDTTMVSIDTIEKLVSVIWVQDKNVVAHFSAVDHRGEVTYYIFKEVDTLVLNTIKESTNEIQ